MQDNLRLIGHINLKLYGSDGILKQEIDKPNVVVTVGKVYLASWLAAVSQAGYFMQYIGLGTGATGASASDTTLQTELATRVAGTITSNSTTWQNMATFGPGINTGALTESGLFTASSGGIMMARQTFGTLTKAAGDTVVFSWTLTIS